MKFKIKGGMVYFDRDIIRSNWSRMNRGPLSRAGALVRKISRNSIRRRSYRTVSPPGHAPYSHQPGKTPPFKMIYNLPMIRGSSEIIGMVGFGDNAPAPGVHEHGLTKRVRTIIHRPGYHRSYSRRQRRWRMARNYRVINASTRFPKRPFMLPALETAAPKLPPLWRGSLGGKMAF